MADDFYIPVCVTFLTMLLQYVNILHFRGAKFE